MDYVGPHRRAGVLMGAVACIAGIVIVLLRPTVTGGAQREPEGAWCNAELWSWVVAEPHPGRHLSLLIDCGPAHAEFSGCVEFTSAALRTDYDRSNDHAPRVARMTRHIRLRPLTGSRTDTERLEYAYELTLDQARCLQRDRVWSAPYQLIGTNSSSAMRHALEDCGCSLPDHILRGGGFLGTFPGIDLSPGEEVGPADWGEFGLPEGPTPPQPPPIALPGQEVGGVPGVAPPPDAR